ncbi:MAG: hypothetical protein GC180_02045 [Bacteroidetes bacterium]|nr:hypothetical protein [Bacteroidota bacterium]
MKRFGILITVLSLSLGLFAQEQHGRRSPAERAQMRTKMMTNKLKLTETQIPKVEAINLAFAQAADSIRKNVSDRTQKKAQLSALESDTNAKMQTVLTHDQYTEYLKMVEMQKQKMQERQKRKPQPEEEE